MVTRRPSTEAVRVRVGRDELALMREFARRTDRTISSLLRLGARRLMSDNAALVMSSPIEGDGMVALAEAAKAHREQFDGET